MRRPARGFTLIEVMITALIGIIIVGAAFGLFSAISAVNDRTERVAQAASSVAVAMQSLNRNAENAAANFRARRVAVQVYDNVGPAVSPFVQCTSPATGTGCSPLQMDNLSATGFGLQPNTDALEVFLGNDPLQSPQGAVTATTASTVTLSTSSLMYDAFRPTAPGYSGFADPKLAPVAVVSRGTNMRLIRFVTPVAPLVNEVSPGGANVVQTRITESPPSSNPWAIDPVLTGVTAGMDAYLLARRLRYIIYKAGAGGRAGLYVQESGPNGYLGVPRLLASGVEDMQLAPVWTGIGCATAATGVPCECNQTLLAADACTGPAGSTSLSFAEPYDQVSPQSDGIVGVLVRLQARGAQDAAEPGGRLLQMFNRPAVSIPPVDNVRRDLKEQRLDFVNLNSKMVTPS
jgi:type II secretory pathway pseudopilin PulG